MLQRGNAYLTLQRPVNVKDTQIIIHIIGLGVAESANLTPDAKAALLNTQCIIGSKRQLETLSHELKNTAIKQLELPPLSQLQELIEQLHLQRIVILASGDPLYYGIGRWLTQRYPKNHLHFYPAISSIQAACHALGLSLQDVKVVSLHGRPLLCLRRHLSQQRYLLLLTDKHSHPQAIAKLCVEAGFTDSRLWLCEQLGYPNEQIREFSVTDLAVNTMLKTANLNICILELSGQNHFAPCTSGIADKAFVTDSEAGKGMLTKREIRVNILALLQPQYDDIGWDIGAGCGGVAIEWALAHDAAHIHAIEHHPKRIACLEQNQQRFGVVQNLHITAERAPDCLESLPTPTKIFIGGSDGELESLLTYCWGKLPANGILVCSAVTETTRATCLTFADTLSEESVETVQIAVSKGGKLAGQWVYRPNFPVTLFKFSKEWES